MVGATAVVTTNVGMVGVAVVVNTKVGTVGIMAEPTGVLTWPVPIAGTVGIRAEPTGVLTWPVPMAVTEAMLLVLGTEVVLKLTYHPPHTQIKNKE